MRGSNVETPAIRAGTSPAKNVLLGFMGYPIPPMPRQRNLTRASYRKTSQRRRRPAGQKRRLPLAA